MQVALEPFARSRRSNLQRLPRNGDFSRPGIVSLTRSGLIFPFPGGIPPVDLPPGGDIASKFPPSRVGPRVPAGIRDIQTDMIVGRCPLVGGDNNLQLVYPTAQTVRYSRNKGLRRIDINPCFLMVGAPGFEPGASCSRSRRSTGLSHAPNSTLKIQETVPVARKISEMLRQRAAKKSTTAPPRGQTRGLPLQFIGGTPIAGPARTPPRNPSRPVRRRRPIRRRSSGAGRSAVPVVRRRRAPKRRPSRARSSAKNRP